MAETEREKQELHEEKLKAVENVEKRVRKQNLTCYGCSFSTSAPFSEFEFHIVQAALVSLRIRRAVQNIDNV